MAILIGKEVHQLQQNISELTEGQARVSNWDPDDLLTLTVDVTANGGYYKGECHKFVIKLSPSYPVDPPSVTCISNIFHPNIDPRSMTYSNVCLNILDIGEWCPAIGLAGCVQGLVFLLHNPNIQDPISPHFYAITNEKHYARHLKNLKKGRDPYTFSRYPCCGGLCRQLLCCFVCR